MVNESIDFLKSSLEKTGSGFVKLRDYQTTEGEGSGTLGATANSSVPLAKSVTNVKDEAAIHMLLACKRNVILFHFFRTGMFSLAAYRQRASEINLCEFSSLIWLCSSLKLLSGGANLSHV